MIGPVAATVMVTGLYLAIGQTRSLASSAGVIVESVAYAGRLRDFVARDFQGPVRPGVVPPGTPPSPSTEGSLAV